MLNNNTIALHSKGYDFEFKPTNQTFERKIDHSSVLIYNFEEGSFTPLYEDVFIKKGIFTDAAGLYNILPLKVILKATIICPTGQQLIQMKP